MHKDIDEVRCAMIFLVILRLCSFSCRWSDQTGNTKAVLLVANLFEVTGNIMYFMGLSGWFLVASRFVAGKKPTTYLFIYLKNILHE